MKILFSPSEDKNINYEGCKNSYFLKDLLFGENLRMEFFQSYIDFLKNSKNINEVVGSKDSNIINRCKNIESSPLQKAIHLYSGVGYKALDISSIPKDSLEFIYENVIIFSNLFGPIRANDEIPYYKLKQGKKINNKSINDLYKNFRCVFAAFLDSNIDSNAIIDLRAEFYVNALKLNIPHTKVEFFKNGKKISHLSKYYKGLLLREIALKKDLVFSFKNARVVNTRKEGFARILEFETLGENVK